MESPARFTFNGLTGATTVFPIPAEIKGDNYCRVELDDVIVGDLTKYDIVNNSIVFTNAADLVGVAEVSVLVVQSEEAAATLKAVIKKELAILSALDPATRINQRIDKFGAMGEVIE